LLPFPSTLLLQATLFPAEFFFARPGGRILGPFKPGASPPNDLSPCGAVSEYFSTGFLFRRLLFAIALSLCTGLPAVVPIGRGPRQTLYPSLFFLLPLKARLCANPTGPLSFRGFEHPLCPHFLPGGRWSPYPVIVEELDQPRCVVPPHKAISSFDRKGWFFSGPPPSYLRGFFYL